MHAVETAAETPEPAAAPARVAGPAAAGAPLLHAVAGTGVPVALPGSLAALDPQARASVVLGLQRSGGNAFVHRLLRNAAPAPAVLARCPGGAAHGPCPCECEEEEEEEQRLTAVPLALARAPSRGSAPGRALQRSEENERTLAEIQGHAMFALLPRLEQLKGNPALDDTAAAQHVGGPRLVLAIKVVKAKGTPWLAFADANNAELAALPSDQVGDIIRYLGGPEVRQYPASDFKNRYEGIVDPTAGTITLVVRIKFEIPDGALFREYPGGPVKDADVVKREFAAQFVSVIQSTWRTGSVRPACALGRNTSFKANVVVHAVTSGEHFTFHIVPDAPGRSHASDKSRSGVLKDTDVLPTKQTKRLVDPTGKRPVEGEFEQVPAAHEFGHAIGLHHPHCEGPDENCYGVTEEEYRDVMGGGGAVQTIKRKGQIVHDDFEPFQKVGERYGKDMFPGALAGKCNTWSAG